MATIFQMRAGLEGAGAGPFCGLKGQEWLPSGTNPFSAAEHFLRLDSAAQRSAIQLYSWEGRKHSGGGVSAAPVIPSLGLTVSEQAELSKDDYFTTTEKLPSTWGPWKRGMKHKARPA